MQTGGYNLKKFVSIIQVSLRYRRLLVLYPWSLGKYLTSSNLQMALLRFA